MEPANSNQEMSEGQRWRDLALNAQEGDRRAYAQLLREIAPFIRMRLIGSLANPDWADDITQEVLISVHKSLHTYSADRPFRPWLAAIVNFRRADYLRKHYSARGNRQAFADDAVFMGQHVTDPGRAGELKDIEGVLAALPEKQRRIFELVKIRGYTAREVAKKMGMSVTAVKVSAHRTLNRLKTALDE